MCKLLGKCTSPYGPDIVQCWQREIDFNSCSECHFQSLHFEKKKIMTTANAVQRMYYLHLVVKHILGIVCCTVQRRRHALFYDNIPHPQRLQAVHIRNIKHFLGCQGNSPFVFSLAWLSYSLLLIYDVGYFCDIVMQCFSHRRQSEACDVFSVLFVGCVAHY